MTPILGWPLLPKSLFWVLHVERCGETDKADWENITWVPQSTASS